jgi:hypothetical protein
VQQYASFETSQHVILFTQKNETQKLTQGSTPSPTVNFDNWFPGITILKKIFMDMLQNALHHDLKFILKEHVLIILSSSLTRSLLLDMYSPVNVLLIMRQIKHWDPKFLICYDI